MGGDDQLIILGGKFNHYRKQPGRKGSNKKPLKRTLYERL